MLPFFAAMHRLHVAKMFAAMGEDMTELAAEEMRTGIRALDALVGRIDVENLLDEIFASFCLGK